MFMLLLCLLAGTTSMVHCEDPYFYFTWNITYGTISPAGVPQQVILINNEFPGPNINSTSNNNLVVNVFNNLDEPFLFHWYYNIAQIYLKHCMISSIYIVITTTLIEYLINMQGGDTTKEELMARWCGRNKLSNPTRNKLHIQISSEGSDWKLLLLP